MLLKLSIVDIIYFILCLCVLHKCFFSFLCELRLSHLRVCISLPWSYTRSFPRCEIKCKRSIWMSIDFLQTELHLMDLIYWWSIGRIVHKHLLCTLIFSKSLTCDESFTLKLALGKGETWTTFILSKQILWLRCETFASSTITIGGNFVHCTW